MTYLCSH